MVMKVRVKSLDEVDEKFHSEYVKDGEEYVLQTEGEAPGVEAMRRARDNEKEQHKTTKSRLRDLETEMDGLRTQLADKSGNSDTIHKSWEKKFNDKVAEYDGIVAGLNSTLSNVTVGSVAKDLSKIFIAPKFAERAIRDRLTTEIVDGVPHVRVLDANGKPSAMTIAELEKEFREDESLAGALVGSQGSGGGNPSPGQPKNKSNNPQDWTEAERAELLKTDPAKFHTLFPKKGVY